MKYLCQIKILPKEKDILLLEETKNEKKSNQDCINQTKIIFKNFSSIWNQNSINIALRSITLNFSNKKLYVITGTIGSGKSNLLKAILQELHPCRGRILINGRVSYASQESWLYPGNVRDNILFYEAYEASRYSKVLNVCALEPDLKNLPDEDLTVVDDGGLNLSGGQRARINLARAIYKNADIYLIDNTLTAVDVNVGKYIFDNCINGFLKNKLRIVISHNTEHFVNADRIIIMKNGKVEFCGSYTDLIASNYNISKPPVLQTPIDKFKKTSDDSISNEINFVVEQYNREKIDAISMKKETKNWLLFWRYFRAGGSRLTVLCLISSLIITRIAVCGYDYCLAHWVQQDETENKISNDDFSNSLKFKESSCILISLLIISIITWTASSLLFYQVCIKASENLHNQMLYRLLRAPMQFFDLNPSGNILNRFSKDIGLVDETLPTVTLDALHVIFMMIGVSIQISIINPSAIFPIIAVGTACWKFQNIYLLFAQKLQRLESEAKSPVFSHIKSTLAGLTTIRCYPLAASVLRREYEQLQDVHSSAYHLSFITSSAYGFWLDIGGASLLVFVVFGLVLVDEKNTAGTTGLAITQLMLLYGSLQYGLRQSAQMLTQMVGIERIFQFVNLRIEEEEEIKGSLGNKKIIPDDWPSQGRVEFRHLVLRYPQNQEPVLKNVSFSIEPREKVGLIGRTGAGKTSLISALFLLTKPDEGTIFIDDVDIKNVELRELRRRISVIPQEPVIFTGSVRDNLDPTHMYEDKTLWQVLTDVGLQNYFNTLDDHMKNRGVDLSTGQKQLFCLARVLLADNKILILDEATAHVDMDTDEVIGKIIKRTFSDCTILIIAHRRETIIQSDRILIMEKGQIVE